MRVGYNILQETIAELLSDRNDDLLPQVKLASQRIKLMTCANTCVGFLSTCPVAPTDGPDQESSEHHSIK